jgi:hypothetical protein
MPEGGPSVHSGHSAPKAGPDPLAEAASNPDVHTREFAIEVFDLIERLGQAGFTGASDAAEPEDGTTAPELLDLIDPEAPFDHTRAALRLV